MTIRATNPIPAELEQEAATTRRFLERVPEAHLSWRPHPKSFTLGQLALHLAGTPGNVARMSELDSVPLPEFGNVDQPTAVADILTAHDEGLAAARAIISVMSDERAMETWRVMHGDREVMAMPRIALLRAIALNHCYHHRGQLSLHLRLLDVPGPSAYGPTADENPFGA